MTSFSRPSLDRESQHSFKYWAFISYSHADKDFARKLHNVLQENGIRVWLDEKQLIDSRARAEFRPGWFLPGPADLDPRRAETADWNQVTPGVP